MKCKDCKYFEPLTGFTDKSRDNTRGDCKKIFEEYGDLIAPKNRIIFGCGGHYDSVTVGINFGCLHFKPCK